jgi:hypothetical protein
MQRLRKDRDRLVNRYGRAAGLIQPPLTFTGSKPRPT